MAKKCGDCDTQLICCRRTAQPAPPRLGYKCRSCGKVSRTAGKDGICAGCLGIIRCPRCEGKGTILRYQHVNGGKCGLCGGTGRADSYRAAFEKPAECLPHNSPESQSFLRNVISQQNIGAGTSVVAVELRVDNQQLCPPPEPPPKLDKGPVIEAALGDRLDLAQIRAVLDSYSRYDFTTEELDLLRYCERIEHAKRPRIAASPMAVHSNQDWWSRDR